MTRRLRPRLAAPAARAAATLLIAALFGPAPGVAQEHPAAEWLPPDAERAVEALNASPRHGEWVMVRLPDGDSVRSWVVYPEVSGPAPVMVVIHEIYGLTNWVRAVADQAAEDGFIAIAPDLLTMRDVPAGPEGDPERQAAVAAVRALDADAVHRQIRAVAEFAMALPAARPRYGIMGFCWGGSASFEHATRYPDILAAAVFYGSSPDAEAMARVRAPVLGLYGGDDERVNATIPRAREALGDGYYPVIFEGAGHGFLRQQQGRDGANMAASLQAWPRVMGFFAGAAFDHDARNGG